MTNRRANLGWLITALLGLVMAAVGARTAEAGPGDTKIALIPQKIAFACGESKTQDVKITGVTNLFGVDLTVTYDPAVADVVDANAGMPGVQVQPGNLPDTSNGQGLVQTNSVDLATGTIRFAAIRLNPAPAQSGDGVIFSITFKAKAAGTSQVAVQAAVLSDPQAHPIQALLVDGELNATCEGGPPTNTPTPSPTPRPGDATRTPTPNRPTPIPGKECDHRVAAGETLYSIARIYGSTVAEFLAINKLYNPNLIYVGQKLIIPGCKPGTGGPGATPSPSKCYTHVVKPGDTVYRIALTSGDTVAGISSRNKLANPNWLWVGQALSVCPGGYTPGTGGYPGGKCRLVYYVKPGETLWSIAFRNGTSVSALTAANNLANPNLIYAGQALCIP